jgi:hypothetical protein
MASAYLFVMLAITPLESREVALIANPEFEAGRGVIHNENPLPGTTTHALQLWVNLPASEKMAAPRYQDLRGADLPRRREPGVEIRLLSGSSGGVSSPTLNHVPVAAIDARMDDDARFEHELEAGANAFLLVLEGSAIVGRQERPVASGELAWLTRSDEAPSLVTIKASGGATHLLLFAGMPLREPVVFGGPFVMNIVFRRPSVHGVDLAVHKLVADGLTELPIQIRFPGPDRLPFCFRHPVLLGGILAPSPHAQHTLRRA